MKHPINRNVFKYLRFTKAYNIVLGIEKLYTFSNLQKYKNMFYDTLKTFSEKIIINIFFCLLSTKLSLK